MGETWDLGGAVVAWEGAWLALGVAEPSGLLWRLTGAYSEAGRAYHTGQHLAECFGHLAGVGDRLDRPGEVALALWFHDAIYDPHRSDNEEASAEWAVRELAGVGVDPATTDRVAALIRATRHDATPAVGDAATLVDIDLAILGAGKERFDEYEAQVRREYAFVADEAFRRGRSQILRAFLDRPRIYATPPFHDRLEGSARANLARSLGRLTGPDGGST